MIGQVGWDIIKLRDAWIDVQGVNMGVPSKLGHSLQLIDARGVVENRMGGKRYLVILRQAFFNPNSDETLFTEDQKSSPMVLRYIIVQGSLVENNSLKLETRWDVPLS